MRVKGEHLAGVLPLLLLGTRLEDETMSVRLKSVKDDVSLQLLGDIVNSSIYPGVSYTVRSPTYPAYVRARDYALKALSARYPNGDAPEEETAKLDGALLVEHLLLSWSGFDEPFSKELALSILTDSGYRDLRTDVHRSAARVGKRAVEFLEETVKN